MKTDYVQIGVLAFTPLVLRFALYYAAFRVRSISIKVLTCAIIAGSTYLLAIIPIPLPREVTFVAAVGFAMFLITRYTEADLFPDALLIPLVVELISTFLINDVIAPVLQ